MPDPIDLTGLTLPVPLAAAGFLALCEATQAAVALREGIPGGRLHASTGFCRLAGLSAAELAGLDDDALTTVLSQRLDEEALQQLQRRPLSWQGKPVGEIWLVATGHERLVQQIARLRHDARNPLTAMQVYTECLLEDPDLTHAQEDDLRRLLGEIRRLTAILLKG